MESADMSEQGDMLSSYETTCLMQLSVRAFSSDRELQAKRVIWREIVPIYAEDLPCASQSHGHGMVLAK
jgi:hypothetical protein